MICKPKNGVSPRNLDVRTKPLMVTGGGIVVLMDGEHETLTDVVQKLLNSGKPSQRQESLRFYRWFLETAAAHGPHALSFLEYDDHAALALVIDALQQAGLVVEKQKNLSDNYSISVAKGAPNYLGRYAARIRGLFGKLIEKGLFRNSQNPAEVVGWHRMLAAQRLEFAKATIRNPYGHRYAGARFHVKGARRNLGRPENPEGVRAKMTEAVLESPAPEVIKKLALTFDCDAPRVNELLPADARGWSFSDFGKEVRVGNKWEDDPYAKPVELVDEVHAWLVRNFESRPHPARAGRSMMDYLRELAAQGDAGELEKILLFAKANGDAYSPSGFRYWFQDAMLNAGVKAGSWTPSPHFYRNCRMHGEVTEIFNTCAPGPERDRQIEKVGQEFGHSSQAWRSYVRYASDMESRRVRRANAERRQLEAAARRQGVPLPPRSPRLANPNAAKAHSDMPRRGLQ